MYTHSYIYIYINLYVYIHLCICIYTYIYIYTSIVDCMGGCMDRRIDVSDITVAYIDGWMLGWCYFLIFGFGGQRRGIITDLLWGGKRVDRILSEPK